MRQVWPNRIKILIALIPAVLGLLSIWFFNYGAANTINWEQTKLVLEVVQSALTIIALFVGAIWAYFNFFKGRTYRPRLEPKISGQIITKAGANYLIITAQLKNVGLSDVKINQKGSALRLFSYEAEQEFSKVHSVAQTRLLTVGVFEQHGWIEPGETIEDQRLIALPRNELIAIQARIRLVSNRIEWNTATIIEPPALANGVTKQLEIAEGRKNILESRDPKTLNKGTPALNLVAASTSNLSKTTMQKVEHPGKTDEIENEKEPTSEIQVKKSSGTATQTDLSIDSENKQMEN